MTAVANVLTESGASIQSPIDTPQQRACLDIAARALGGELMRTVTGSFEPVATEAD